MAPTSNCREGMVVVSASEELPQQAASVLLAAGWTGRFVWTHPDHPGRSFNGAGALLEEDPVLAKVLLEGPSDTSGPASEEKRGT